MKQKSQTPQMVFILVGALVLVAGGVYAYMRQSTMNSNQVAESTPTPTASASVASVTASAQANTASTGTYTTYEPGIIEKTSGKKILFFHASWCPDCRALDASIRSGKIPQGVTIIKVDYDSNQALRKTYGVKVQTTLVRVGDDGKLEASFVASSDPSLTALIKNIL